jgi:hypothetical protein
MTDREQHELVGRLREQYKQGKKEQAALKAKAREMAEYAEKIGLGLRAPEMIRWWDGIPMIGQRSEHVIFTSQIFEQLGEKHIKQLCADLKRVEASLASWRQELTALDGDPERPA